MSRHADASWLGIPTTERAPKPTRPLSAAAWDAHNAPPQVPDVPLPTRPPSETIGGIPTLDELARIAPPPPPPPIPIPIPRPAPTEDPMPAAPATAETTDRRQCDRCSKTLSVRSTHLRCYECRIATGEQSRNAWRDRKRAEELAKNPRRKCGCGATIRFPGRDRCGVCRKRAGEGSQAKATATARKPTAAKTIRPAAAAKVATTRSLPDPSTLPLDYLAKCAAERDRRLVEAKLTIEALGRTR